MFWSYASLSICIPFITRCSYRNSRVSFVQKFLQLVFVFFGIYQNNVKNIAPSAFLLVLLWCYFHLLCHGLVKHPKAFIYSPSQGIHTTILVRLLIWTLHIVFNLVVISYLLKKPLGIWWGIPCCIGGTLFIVVTDFFLLPAFMHGSEMARLTIKMLLFPIASWFIIALRRSCSYKYFEFMLNLYRADVPKC